MANENKFLSEIKNNIRGLHELNTLAETNLEPGDEVDEIKEKIRDTERDLIFKAMAAYCMK